MKIQKKYLELLFETLNNTELSLADSRVRDSFLKKVAESVNTSREERKKILETYAKKDEEGNFDFITNDKGEKLYQFPSDIQVKLNEELVVLAEEEVEIESSEEVTPKIKEFINNTSYKPLPGEAELIDTILEKFV